MHRHLTSTECHNIPIPSSPSSPHPLATASSSGAPLSASALPPLIVPPPSSTGAACSERGGFGGPDPGTCHETSIGPTVGKIVPLAYPCFNPPSSVNHIEGEHPSETRHTCSAELLVLKETMRSPSASRSTTSTPFVVYKFSFQ